VKLNLGCGKRQLSGYINIDINPDLKPDIIRDITRGLPFEDNTIDEIVCKDFIEHISMGEDLIFVMNEMYRVLKPEGILQMLIPHTYSYGAFCDPTHKSFWNQESIKYWTGQFDQGYGIKTKFKVLENKINGIYLEVVLQK